MILDKSFSTVQHLPSSARESVLNPLVFHPTAFKYIPFQIMKYHNTFSRTVLMLQPCEKNVFLGLYAVCIGRSLSYSIKCPGITVVVIWHYINKHLHLQSWLVNQLHLISSTWPLLTLLITFLIPIEAVGGYSFFTDGAFMWQISFLHDYKYLCLILSQLFCL